MEPKLQKLMALRFLELASSGRAKDAATRFVAPGAVHHNPHVEAGFPALTKAMDENHERFPNKRFEVQRSVAEGDLVAVHSRVVHDAGLPTVNVVHIFRFADNKIAELWDIGTQVPKDSPNLHGAF